MRFIATAVVLLSAFVLCWQIGIYPISPSIYEGLTGLTVLRLLEGDKETISRVWQKPIYDQAGGGTGVAAGSENLFLVYPAAFLVKLFPEGDGYTVLRVIPIIYGVLSIWILYLLISRLFSRGVGLAASFLLATSSWSLVYTRLAADLSATVIFTLLCFYIFVAIDRWENPLGYIILGGLTALATYFYLPARIVFPMVAFVMVMRMLVEKGYCRARYKYFIIMAAAFAACLYAQQGNLLTYFRHNVPGDFYFWTMRPNVVAGDMLQQSLAAALQQFIRCDAGAWFDVYERGPYIDPVSRYAFLVGLIWAVIRIRRPSYRFLLIWSAAGLAPMLLTFSHSRRALLFNPAFVSLAAVGIHDSFDLLVAWTGRARNYLSAGSIAATIILAGYLNLENYFGGYSVAAADPNNKVVRREKGRLELIELMKHGQVYTDLYTGEYGWRETMEYEQKRRKNQYGIKTMRTDQAIAAFDSCESPCVLYLQSGLVRKK